MTPLKQIIVEGAKVQLAKLEKEAEYLRKLIEKNEPEKFVSKAELISKEIRKNLKKRHRKGLHWTQMPENKARLRKMRKKAALKRDKK